MLSPARNGIGFLRYVLVLFMVAGIGLIWYSNHPFFDFAVFWTASRMALEGQPLNAYDVASLQKAILAAAPYAKWDFGWYYPPTFYLMILPLGLLPFFPAYFVFMLSTLAYLRGVLQRIVPGSGAVWCLASSATGLNLFTGQNGFLTAALAGGALLSLERRPALAGLLIGLLSFKPHLVLLFPVALVAIGAWRALFSAFTTTLVFMGGAVLILGADTIPAWLHSLIDARNLIEFNTLSWTLMPTVFALLRQLGLSVTAAYAGHAVVALGAIGAVWKIWRSCNSLALRYAVLTAATLLVSPYMYYYDLTWLVLPMAWLAQLAQRGSWRRGELGVLSLAWLLPMLMGLTFMFPAIRIQIGPLVLLGVLWVIMRRA